ncbi:MAG: M64 family metallopeptidase, partial [Pseudomonadota bacterium]
MMKKFLLAFLLVIFSIHSYAQYTFSVDTILNNGPKANRINLVFLGDGYTAAQQTQFITDVNTVMTRFFQTSPFDKYKPFFNVYAVKVISAESGAKHPNTAADCANTFPSVPALTANTFFGATFDYGGIHILLYTPNSTAING